MKTAALLLIVPAAIGVGVALGFYIKKKFDEQIPPPPGKPEPWIPKEVVFSKLKIKGKIMATQAQVDQTFFVTWPEPVDKYGNPAAVENVRFESSDETRAVVEAAPERGPLTAKVTTKGVLGGVDAKIKADGDIGEGVKELEGIHTVEVLGGDAVAFGEATATTPVDVTEDEGSGGEGGDGENA